MSRARGTTAVTTRLPTCHLRTLVKGAYREQKHGCGLAVCPSLGALVVTNMDNSVDVFRLPAGASEPFVLLRSFGGSNYPDPSLRFQLFVDGMGGWVCFTCEAPPAEPLLLVPDMDRHEVRLVDVQAPASRGVFCEVQSPRAVAASPAFVGVTAWSKGGGHGVHLFDAGTRALVRVLGQGLGTQHLNRPRGLHLSADGVLVAVADSGNDRVALFRLATGRFVGEVKAGPGAALFDVVECEGGWLAACGRGSVCLLSGGDGAGDVWGDGDEVPKPQALGVDCPTALVLVPDLGLVVRAMNVLSVWAPHPHPHPHSHPL